MSKLMGLLAVVVCLLAIAAVASGKRSPRASWFMAGIAGVALGAWLIGSTLELAALDQAHTFSRSATVFSKDRDPDRFALSFRVHIVLGAVAIVGGGVSILATLPKNWPRFERFMRKIGRL